MAFTFGNPATSTTFGTSSGFGFGTTPATTSNTGFSFGNPITTSSTSFSFPSTSTAAPFNFTGIGTTTTTASFGFGGFGAPSTTSSFSFGAVSTSQPTPVDTITSLVAALNRPTLFGDERDGIMAKFNLLQASLGVGKGYYLPNTAPVDFTPENPFCCFKSVGYICMPSAKSEDCLMGVIFNKKDQEIVSQQQQVVDALHKCLGSKPTISISIDGIKALPEDRTEVVLYLVEKMNTGLTRRVPPSEICSYIEQPTIKPQLSNIGIISVAPKIELSKEQLQHYYDNPQAGIEPIVWKQAKLDNPDPDKLIPFPLVGFQGLFQRMKCQEYETKQHQKRLDIISDDIVDLNCNHTTTVAKITEQKRKLLELQHRILKVLVQQEIMRKMGYSIQADEEQLRVKLEAIQAELSAPTQFKGHLKELTSQIRMQNYKTSSFEGERYSIDKVSKEEIKEQLLSQQEGISLLINIIKEDTADLNTIQSVMQTDTVRKR